MFSASIAQVCDFFISARGVKQRPVDILVGTKSGFAERKDQFTVENEVLRKGILIYKAVC